MKGKKKKKKLGIQSKPTGKLDPDSDSTLQKCFGLRLEFNMKRTGTRVHKIWTLLITNLQFKKINDK